MGASKLSDGEGLRGARDSGVLGQDARDGGRRMRPDARREGTTHRSACGLLSSGGRRFF